MTLSELLEGRFRPDVRFRGEGLLKAERVAITRVTPDQLYGIVRENSGEEHETQLYRLDDKLLMHCGCPKCARSSREPACKYLWATVLAAEEGSHVVATARPGGLPSFAAEPVSRIEVDPDEDFEFDDDAELEAPTNGHVAPKENYKPLRDWERRLQELRRDLQDQALSRDAGTPDPDREIFYEIDTRESRSIGRLVVQTSQRQRRASGQWGKLKPLRLRTGQLDEIDADDDRRILTYLAGGVPERTGWLAQQAENQATTYRYQVPRELAELLLPMMCETERVRILDGDDFVIRWDDGPPWELAMRLEWIEDEDRWALAGELKRATEDGDHTIPINDAKLLVPGGLVVTETHIARLRDFHAFAWVGAFSAGNRAPLSLRSGEEEEFVDQLLDMPNLPRLELPDKLRLEEVELEPTPQLIVQTPQTGRGWQAERLYGQVRFDYLGTPISGTSDRWAIVQREEGRCVMRDRNFEEAAWRRLKELGFRRHRDVRNHRKHGHDVEIPARELGPAVRDLCAEGWEVRADGHHIRQAEEIQFNISSGIDWFELHADVSFDGQPVAFPELLRALARGDTTVRLADGSLGILPDEWAARYGLLSGLGETVREGDEEHLRFSNAQAALLDALLAGRQPVNYDARFGALRERLQSFAGVTPVDEPQNFHGTLRGYQREGLGWLDFLKEFHFGGCLADDMGLGKTVQVLALLLERYREVKKSDHRPSLIVVPKSLLFNWMQESERFTPKLKVLEYTGSDRASLRDSFKKHDLILTTYGTLRRDAVALKDFQFDYAVLDEAQTIKNAGSQVAKAARLLEANHRIALSGTPIENHLGDLWSIFEFLNPNMLGRSSVFKTYAADLSDEESRRLLVQGLRPFILRRTKSQVAAELPEKTEQTLYCDMRPEQRAKYNELKEHYRHSLLGMVKSQGINKTRMHVLEALLRLRQAACHPGLLDDETRSSPGAKLEVLLPQLEELLSEGHKALVFSQFTSMLSIVREHFDNAGITYEYLDGKTRDRKKRVERFQSDPDVGVFLISLKAGGLGLNLTAADYVYLLDPWWNPAVEAQAIDRAHRVGQTRQVFAYRLICRDTVEEKIAVLQQKKRSLADAILEADNTNVLKELTAEDLELLLS